MPCNCTRVNCGSLGFLSWVDLAQKKSLDLKLFLLVGRIGFGHWLFGRGLGRGLASAGGLQMAG